MESTEPSPCTSRLSPAELPTHSESACLRSNSGTQACLKDPTEANAEIHQYTHLPTVSDTQPVRGHEATILTDKHYGN